MTIPEGYTQAQWDDLTEEEQEGILSEEGEEEEEEDEEAQAEAERAREAAQARAAEEEARAAAAAKKPEEQQAVVPVKEEEKPVEEKPVETQEEESINTRRPRGVINDTLPEDYDARVKANDEAQDANEKAYDDGDISHQEYRKEMRRLDKESRELDRLKDRADLAQESAHNAMLTQWEAHIGAFLPLHPELTTSQLKQNAFDECLRATTGAVLEKGGVPGPREIQKAYDTWCAEFNFTPKAPDPVPTPGKKQNKVPPVLGAVPASTQMDTEDGRWANLDRLAERDPEAYEEALSKLSKADADAYLQA